MGREPPFVRVAAPVVGALLLCCLAAPAVAEQARTQSCPPGTPRDVEGYCIDAAPPRPSPTPDPRPAPTVERRPPGPRVVDTQSSTELGGASTYFAPRPGVQAAPPPPLYGGTAPYPSTPAPVEASPRRRTAAWPWVVLGTGLALALTGGVLDVVAFVDSRRTDPFDEIGQIDEWAAGVEAEALAGDVLLFVGAAVAVGGLVWLLVSRRIRRTQRAAADRWAGAFFGGRVALL